MLPRFPMSQFVPLVVLVVTGVAGCTGNPAKSSPGAASPEKPKAEADLAFTTISKKAYVALAVKTEPASVKEVRERLALTGWIMAKPGNEVTLTAPTAGYVVFRDTHHVPVAGEQVKAGQEIAHLDPVLTAVEKIQVAALKRGIESELVKAGTALKTCELDFERAKELQKIRSKQEFEQAQKAYDFAKEELAAAKDKLTFFATQSIKLTAPQAGTVLQVHAGPGQYVPASAPLITIIDLNPVWVRVPVPEFDLPLVDPKEDVSISWKNPGQDQTVSFFKAKAAGRVLQVDPLKHTADLWYQMEGTTANDRFVKDQKVTVHVPIGKMEKATVVPYSAIVFDAYGQTWIYLERTAAKDAKHRFERRRIEMVAAGEGGLIVRPPLAPGELVVVNGAGVLFSREFHKTPVHIPGEDD